MISVLQAYCTARMLFDLANQLSSGQEESLMSMLYPPDSHPDDNPVFVLCRNDPCSFTWTGEEHIQQVSPAHLPLFHGGGAHTVDQPHPLTTSPCSMGEEHMQQVSSMGEEHIQ